MGKFFNIVKIDQNGRRVLYKESLNPYVANKLCRDLNKELKLSNPHKLRKFEVEPGEEE